MNTRKGDNSKSCCGTCLYYNGLVGDGSQFCDRREIMIEDTDYCVRYQYCDKSEFERED